MDFKHINNLIYESVSAGIGKFNRIFIIGKANRQNDLAKSCVAPQAFDPSSNHTSPLVAFNQFNGADVRTTHKQIHFISSEPEDKGESKLADWPEIREERKEMN